MTAEQDALIAQFKSVNAEASSLESYDPGNADRLAALDGQLKALARQLQASGLQMSATGDWVYPNDWTYDYAS